MNFNIVQVLTDSTVSQAAEAAGTSALMSFAPFILIFAIFYFLIILPQKKQQKKHQAMLGALQKGDSIITTNGIHAKIVEIKDQIVKIEIAPKVVITAQRTIIGSKAAVENK